MELPPGSGKFVDIKSGRPHECILNVGDCLQKWTGLHSARHRVHLPEQPQGAQTEHPGDVVDERFSIAYFVKPVREASLRPLLNDVGSGDATGSRHMTAGEFQHIRIQGTYG
jgi:isopenicillin N synthase-like dioxygenase